MSAGFLQEEHGTYSSMRLMSLLSLLAAILFGAMTVMGKGAALPRCGCFSVSLWASIRASATPVASV